MTAVAALELWVTGLFQLSIFPAADEFITKQFLWDVFTEKDLHYRQQAEYVIKSFYRE